MSEIDIAISRQLWWTQNRRSRSWAVPYARKKQVKASAHLTFCSLINSGKLQKPEHWPVHVTAIIHPLTHGRFDPENAAPWSRRYSTASPSQATGPTTTPTMCSARTTG